MRNVFRRLALNDERAIESALGTVIAGIGPPVFDPTTNAVARLAALIALESADASYK